MSNNAVLIQTVLHPDRNQIFASGKDGTIHVGLSLVNPLSNVWPVCRKSETLVVKMRGRLFPEKSVS
jgi:hypothetical protein